MEKWATISNLNGSGHQILIIVPQEGQPVVRAGYFLGTVDEFVNKARIQGKQVQANVVPLVAGNL
jgi:hypothetical protein